MSTGCWYGSCTVVAYDLTDENSLRGRRLGRWRRGRGGRCRRRCGRSCSCRGSRNTEIDAHVFAVALFSLEELFGLEAEHTGDYHGREGVHARVVGEHIAVVELARVG